MILFKICQQFLLPSVFILIVILIGFIFLWRKKKIGKICLIISLVLYYLFSITPVADFILSPLENQYQEIQESDFNEADIIVFLLGGRESSILRANEIFRIYSKKYQSASHKLQIIISGKSIFRPEINRAEEIKNFLTDRGIPAKDIILEGESRNTFESAINIKEIVKENSFFLITSAYHLPRAINIFRKMEMNPIPAPTDFKIEGDYSLLDFFPNSQNLTKVDLAFHEYFGILFYRLFRF